MIGVSRECTRCHNASLDAKYCQLSRVGDHQTIHGRLCRKVRCQERCGTPTCRSATISNYGPSSATPYVVADGEGCRGAVRGYGGVEEYEYIYRFRDAFGLITVRGYGCIRARLVIRTRVKVRATSGGCGRRSSVSWCSCVDDHRFCRLSGAPLLYKDQQANTLEGKRCLLSNTSLPVKYGCEVYQRSIRANIFDGTRLDSHSSSGAVQARHGSSP